MLDDNNSSNQSHSHNKKPSNGVFFSKICLVLLVQLFILSQLYTPQLNFPFFQQSQSPESETTLFLQRNEKIKPETMPFFERNEMVIESETTPFFRENETTESETMSLFRENVTTKSEETPSIRQNKTSEVSETTSLFRENASTESEKTPFIQQNETTESKMMPLFPKNETMPFIKKNETSKSEKTPFIQQNETTESEMILPFQKNETTNSETTTSLQQSIQPETTPFQHSTQCEHGTVYVYDLPPMFNKDLIKNCHDLDLWRSLCEAVSNNGLGRKATGLSPVPKNLSSAWYWTEMFASEIYFHSRMLNHKCRTTDQESATAFYIPFYAGLAIEKYLFTYPDKDKDYHCHKLIKWIVDQPSWKRSNGSDHFMMLGRMTWDFRRRNDGNWGAKFVNMPQMEHMLWLSVERHPLDEQEISVPYPTGFHPKSKSELTQWVDVVKTRNRRNLFTFVGAKRKKLKGDFRAILYDHCKNESDSCKLVDCSGNRCFDGTWDILDAFLGSDFCLQPRGDAHTRRSTFDCMLAGSIPVFFWTRSIEYQYKWFLGDEREKFSVFIDQKDVRNGTSVREVLEGYSREEVRRLRENVISLIPNFVYGMMDSGEFMNGTTKDAFNIVVDGVLKRFKEQKGL